MQCVVEIEGHLDVEQLDCAAKTLRQRYEILRTVVRVLPSSSLPVQVIQENATGIDEIVAIDQRENLSRAIETLKETYWSAPASRANTTAVTFVLVEQGKNRHWLLLTANVLYADLFTLCLLAKKLREEYSGTRADFEIYQYADLAEWQNQLLENNESEERVPYWSVQDFYATTSLKLPFELRPERQGPITHTCLERAVSSPLAAKLNEAASELEISLDSVLLAAWQVILQRFGRAERFLLGCETTGRSHPELAEAVGPFSKWLPLQAAVDPAKFFSALCKDVDRALQTAESDQFLYDWRIENGSSLESNDGNERILFRKIVVHDPAAAGDSKWKIASFHDHSQPYELRLDAIQAGNNLSLQFLWAERKFVENDIQIVADCYVALLAEVAMGPNRAIRDLTLKNAACPSVLLDSIHGVDENFRPIHQIIEEQSCKFPERRALVCGDDSLSYAELERRANLVAAQLRPLCAERDSIVAIVAQRSMDFFVGLLGTLKAGAAWLPIEPDTPAERIEFILRQAGAAAVLTHRETRTRLGLRWQREFFFEDLNGWEVREKGSSDVLPSQLAYIIFTSGSTGKPKGVAIEHRNIAAYMRAMERITQWPANPSCALVSTIAADLGHSAVFPALMWGGTLHIIPAWQALEAESLADYFLANQVDFVKIVPSHLEALCRAFPKLARLPWKYLMTGGENLSWSVVEALQRLAPGCRLINEYGPTETTVGVFYNMVDRAKEKFAGDIVSIGSVFEGPSAYVLDANLEPQPKWMPGELYLGGSFVGRGYVDACETTAERFLPDLHAGVAGSRMYKTGDVARLRSDGKIDFLGRTDSQIKIRGYRVELGEIEAVLCRHDRVHNAAVVVADEASGSKQLVAWVAVGKAAVTADEVRDFLAKSLPEYMIPASIVCVENLKLSPNGKVDRQALPAEFPQAARHQSAPIDEVEQNLITIWQHVLKLDRVGVEDNYFSLGGDSLKVIQMVHEARPYGILMSATDVLRNQTIRTLRTALRERLHHSLFPEGVPQMPAIPDEYKGRLETGVVDCYPATGIQLYMIEEYARNQGSFCVYHIQERVKLGGSDFSLTELEAAFQMVVERHPSLRTVFDLEASPPMQWVRKDLKWKMGVEDVTALPAEEQDMYISAAVRSDRSRHFDVGDREHPLFRVAVFPRSEREFDFLFSCHHAILDGWGHRVLMNQLFESYQQIRLGEQPALGRPDNTCREFAAYQLAVGQSKRASEFWREYIDGVDIPEFKAEPADDLEPDEPGVACELPVKIAEGIIGLARTERISLQSLLLACWLKALRQWSGKQTVSTGLIANGRSDHLSDPLSAVGLFWNIVPVISREPRPLLEQASSLHQQLIEMEPFLAYPYSQLLSESGRKNLVQSTFRYLNFWNAKELPEESSLQLLDTEVYDCYAFPLNGVVLLRQDGNRTMVILQYDPRSIGPGPVKQLMDCFVQVLSESVQASVIFPN